MFYSISQSQLNLGQVPNTPIYIMGLKMGATLGHRARIQSFSIGLAEVAPMDVQIYGRLAILDNTTDGTGNDVTSTIAKIDPGSRDSVIESAIIGYTAPPTTPVRWISAGAFNARGGFGTSYNSVDLMPKWGPGETAAIVASIGTNPAGNTDVILSVTWTWEEY